MIISFIRIKYMVHRAQNLQVPHSPIRASIQIPHLTVTVRFFFLWDHQYSLYDSTSSDDIRTTLYATFWLYVSQDLRTNIQATSLMRRTLISTIPNPQVKIADKAAGWADSISESLNDTWCEKVNSRRKGINDYTQQHRRLDEHRHLSINSLEQNPAPSKRLWVDQ